MSGGGTKPTVGSGRGHGGGEGHRLLVIAAAAIEGGGLREEVLKHLSGRSGHVLVVAPALADSSFAHAMGDVDEPRRQAIERLDRSLAALRDEGITASGDVGDSDPIMAIEDAVGTFGPDEILVITHPEEHGLWMEDDLFDRARKTFELPIVHVTVGPEGEGVEDIEESQAGADSSDEPEIEGQSDNTPLLSGRDIAGIIVAVLGTIALVVVVASCPGGPGFEALDRCAVATLIAGLMALINVAHVVALTLFESLGYRGGWQRMFANLSLLGTPVALLATLLVVNL
ncbi:MAG: hypothetical protein H0W09_03855 [Solirubrobacterales bacterium]|nr:hypothetical protein [Solirubrobacterales bacterium]